MAILVVHLCDIHIRVPKESNVIFGRVPKLADAIAAEIDPAVTDYVIVLAGDTVFSGGNNEFVAASDFIRMLRQELAQRFSNCTGHLVIAPGNHDCEFTEDQFARASLLQKASLIEVPSASTTALIVKPLSNYFAFSAQMVGVESSLSHDNPFFKEVGVETKDGRISFRIVNSAWAASMNQKNAGSLFYPLPMIPDDEQLASCNYRLTVIHHPSNWFKPEIAKQLCDRLEAISDFILTGHEHVPDNFMLVKSDGSTNRYLEGGVLQSSHCKADSNFTTLKLCIDKSVQFVTQYEWASADRIYIRSREPNQYGAIKTAALCFTEEFTKWLDDPEEVITHPYCERIKLEYIFVCPDVQALDDTTSKAVPHRIRSNDVFDTIARLERALITGSDKSGKTSLAKSMVRNLKEKQYFPLFISAKEFYASGNCTTVEKLIRKKFEEQYGYSKWEHFEQLRKDQKALLIDDIQDVRTNRPRRKELFSWLCDRFGRVYIFGSDEFCLEELAQGRRKESGLDTFPRFEILEFGQSLRQQFVRKWIQLNPEMQLASSECVDHERRVCRAINDVIQINRLPCYPLFLIVLLQQISDVRRPFAGTGSYGYLYEAMVTAMLARSSLFEIPAKYSFLSELAYELFKKGVASLTETQAQQWYKTYCDAYALPSDFVRIQNDLEGLRVLRRDAGNLSFRYKYNYCFFMARYLSEHIHETEAQDIVRDISTRLYHQESADIMVFLAHLSNDPTILSYIDAAADCLFHSIPGINLIDDVKPLNELVGEVARLVAPEEGSDANRRRAMELQDERQFPADTHQSDGRLIEPIPHPVDSPAPSKQLMEIHAALKTIDILGQVIRNGAAARKRLVKQKSVERIYHLGRRLMGFLVIQLNADLPNWVADMKDRILKDHPNIHVEELLRQVDKSILRIIEFAFFAISKRGFNGGRLRTAE